MSDSEDTAYKYTVPLETQDGAEVPSYEPTYDGEVLHKRYTGTSYVVVQTESIPHFHKDSVNVQVEEVPVDEY